MADSLDHLTDSEVEELRKIFYAQAYELLEETQDSLLKLEADPGNEELVKALQRYFHTLKGDSNSIGLTAVGTLCHKVEDVLTLLKDGSRLADHEAIGLILSCVDQIMNMLTSGEAGAAGNGTKGIYGAIDSFLHSVNADQKREVPAAGNDPLTEYELLQIEEAVSQGQKLYLMDITFHPLCTEKGIASFMIGRRLNEIGHLISCRPDILHADRIEDPDRFTGIISAALNASEIQENAAIAGVTDVINVKPYDCSTSGCLSLLQTDSSGLIPEVMLHGSNARPGNDHPAPMTRSETLRVEISKVDNIMDLVGELIIGRSIIEQISRDLAEGVSVQDASARLLAANSLMERTVSDLQKGTMKMRMVQINHVFRKFPKMVRDLSAEKRKLVRLDIFGREAELDKGIVDILAEPLAHIIRNMIDHGLEDPGQRRANGKEPEGVVTLKAFHEASHIVVEVSDDGRGIDTGKLRRKAVEKGLYSADEAGRLSEEAAVSLIFISGLSTSDTLTDTSGRGVGMDVVKAAIEGLKGTIEVETALERGTKFRLRLPLTLAIIKALLFEVDGTLYSIPASAIVEVRRVMSGELTTVDGRDTLLLRDHLISILHLRELFRADSSSGSRKYAIILGIGGRKVGLLVDRLMGQQELVIKALDSRYTQTGLVSGASILGNGRVVLILDAPAIFSKAVEEEKLKAARA